MASFTASTASAYGVCERPGTRHPPRLQKDRSSSTESSHSQDDHKLLRKGNDERRGKREHYSPKKSEFENIEECSALDDGTDGAGNRIVTLTGTIGRGKKNSQAVEVKLALTEQELRRFSTVEAHSAEPGPECLWGPKRGFHIFVLTVLFMPLALLSSLVVTFYMGTLTWYNMYLYFSEERTIWHKIFVCPLLILLYPILIVVISIVISIYATLVQLSWFYQSWIKEVKDFDKGFYAWLCNMLHLSQCAPYQVVILDEKTAVAQQYDDEVVVQEMQHCENVKQVVSIQQTSV